MTLQAWIIEPRDSLIVRDGKPFGANITHATSLDFPFPSTTTGGVRTRIGLNQSGIFDYPLLELKEIEVRGALLVSLKPDDGEIAHFFLPSPADALLVQTENQKLDGKASVRRLLPLKLDNAITNIPSHLLPVGIKKNDARSKPCNDIRFWNWYSLKNWLMDGKDIVDKNLRSLGIKNLTKDSRVHVAINENLASDEGNLFQTRGLEFNYGDGDLVNVRKFALVVFVDDTNSQKLKNEGNFAPLGGERRLVSWRKSNPTRADSMNQLTLECPKEIKSKIDKHCRLMLLTPAYFEDIFSNPNRTDFDVKAIACNRYQTVSGWDFENNEPKPTRRLLPAGSVLFVEIKSDVEAFIQNTWMRCIGDNDQAIKDGFGLCVLGTWDGNL